MEYNNELICSGILNLVKKAKKSGGDRYCGTLTNLGSKTNTNSIIDIYVPQLISRKSESVVFIKKNAENEKNEKNAEILYGGVCQPHHISPTQKKGPRFGAARPAAAPPQPLENNNML